MILKPVVLGKAVFERNAGKKYKKQKPFFDSMDRITWRGRTSDAIGNTYIPDPESGSIDESMEMIRMKIQEKCHSTQELHHHIRRLKIGENKNITPNVFRATLLKFGVVLPQYVVDEVFQVFDKKKNGTMEFDDFCTWVMSAEFDPRNPSTKKTMTHSISPFQATNPLRVKLQSCVRENPLKENLHLRFSFLDLVSFLRSKNIEVSESEMRTAFVELDRKGLGYIILKDLLQWAGANFTEDATVGQHLDVKTAITRICGQKTILVEHCFSHITRGQGMKLGYEEFKRCLVSSGLGAPVKDIYNLFLALGGANENGFANMDLLFESLVPYKPDPALDKVLVSMETGFRSASAGSADRRLREAIRKSFKPLRNALEAADMDFSGFIEAETLNAIINSLCMPISFQDFRLIMRPVKVDEKGRVSWVHFLSLYNPRKEHLHLTAANTGQLPPGKSRPAPMGSLFGDPASRSLSFSSLSPSTDLSSSSSMPALAVSPTKPSSAPSLSLNSARPLPADPSSNPSSSAPPHAEHTRATTAPSLSISSSSPFSSAKPRKIAIMDLAKVTGVSAELTLELRKQWQNLQRDCHRVDTDRVGCLPKSTFVSIIRKAVQDKSISTASISKLADRFRLSDGDIDYVSCIRSCLGDLVGSAPIITRAVSPDRSTYNSSGSLSLTGGREGYMSVQQQLSTAHQMQEHIQILSTYDQKLITICTKVANAHKSVWPQFKLSLRDNQFPNYRGCILQDTFLEILPLYGIQMTSNEKAMLFKVFRVSGVPDAFHFSEFLKLCAACRSSSAGNIS